MILYTERRSSVSSSSRSTNAGKGGFSPTLTLAPMLPAFSCLELLIANQHAGRPWVMKLGHYQGNDLPTTPEVLLRTGFASRIYVANYVATVATWQNI